MSKKTIVNLVVLVVSVKMLVLAIILFSWTRTEPPFHLVPDMDDQPRNRAQKGAMFNHASNTVAYGHLKEDSNFYMGITDPDNMLSFVDKIPVKVDADLMKRGQERYKIYCSPCHDDAGTGRGIITLYSANFNATVPNFHWTKETNPVRPMNDPSFKDGAIFSAITNGKGGMGSYANQISVADRWAIVAYVRALQKLKATEVLTDEYGKPVVGEDGKEVIVNLSQIRMPKPAKKGGK